MRQKPPHNPARVLDARYTTDTSNYSDVFCSSYWGAQGLGGTLPVLSHMVFWAEQCCRAPTARPYPCHAWTWPLRARQAVTPFIPQDLSSSAQLKKCATSLAKSSPRDNLYRAGLAFFPLHDGSRAEALGSGHSRKSGRCHQQPPPRAYVLQ